MFSNWRKPSSTKVLKTPRLAQLSTRYTPITQVFVGRTLTDRTHMHPTTVSTQNATALTMMESSPHTSSVTFLSDRRISRTLEKTERQHRVSQPFRQAEFTEPKQTWPFSRTTMLKLVRFKISLTPSLILWVSVIYPNQSKLWRSASRFASPYLTIR